MWQSRVACRLVQRHKLRHTHHHLHRLRTSFIRRLSISPYSMSRPSSILHTKRQSLIHHSSQHHGTQPLNTSNPTFIELDDTNHHKLSPRINFKIPDDYNWTHTSATNYSLQYNPIDFVDYEYSKSLLDYTYHGYYTQQRQQEVHNPIIAYYKSIALQKLKTPDYLKHHPWILFTAGPMGAGKTHTLQWLAQQNAFPLEAFLKVSPDRIKRFLPEYQAYLKHDEKNVGRMLRTEVGYLCEVIIWEIMHSTKICIWMDSSLRHGSFFETMFKNIHIRFPTYKIGLLNVQCDAQIVFERARKRQQITGRHVPESDIQQSIDEVPKAMALLQGLADIVVQIDNSRDSAMHETPALLQMQCNDRMSNKQSAVIVDHPSWSMFSGIWTGNLPSKNTVNSKL